MRGARHIALSDEQKQEMRELRDDGVSFHQIATQFGISKETAAAVIRGTWTPREVKLPRDDEKLYLDYLMIGSCIGMARLYECSESSVRKRINKYLKRLEVTSDGR